MDCGDYGVIFIFFASQKDEFNIDDRVILLFLQVINLTCRVYPAESRIASATSKRATRVHFSCDEKRNGRVGTVRHFAVECHNKCTSN
ncbi:hypothetical protein SLA2020_108870 [Shorea laevis]